MLSLKSRIRTRFRSLDVTNIGLHVESLVLAREESLYFAMIP